jgi:membrane protease subunit HflC
MRYPVAGIAALIALFVVIIIGYSSVFTVSQTEQVLVVRLGEPVRVVTDPGLNFKAPFIDSVISIDKRILDLENPSQEVIASDQKRLVVDAFARYRIKNALRFYQSVGSIQAANIQLTTLLNASLRRVLGEVTFITVVRDEREALMARIRDQLDKEAEGYGIQVVDVRIRRADLPEQNSQAVYQRMQTERQREAAEFRAQGGQKAQEIRSKADREATVIIAEANSTSEQIRGSGDAERNRLFAEAYGRDPDFFAFYRSMSAYENGLKSNDTRFLLRPDSEFFRFFANPSGHPPAAAAAVAPKPYGFGRPQQIRRSGQPASRHQKQKSADDGRLPSDEVHSVRRLPHRCGNPVCAGRHHVRGEPGLDATGDEERDRDAGPYPACGGHRIGSRRLDSGLAGPALARCRCRPGHHRKAGAGSTRS